MKRAQTEGPVHPETLLDLWMGDEDRRSRPPGWRPSRGMVIGISMAGALIVALLLKYALDVLAILLVLAAVGIALHILGIRLAESEILSPGWFLIFVLATALVAYAVLVPADSMAGLGRYMPKWMVAALEWSESRGWGQRVLIGPGGTNAARPVDVDTSPAPPPSRPVETPASSPAATLVVTASSPTTTEGQPVTFMARLPGDAAAEGQPIVRFFDGRRLLGTASLKADGQTRMAYLTVNGLTAGEHEIRAYLVGPLGATGGESLPLRHTVRRAGR